MARMGDSNPLGYMDDGKHYLLSRVPVVHHMASTIAIGEYGRILE